MIEYYKPWHNSNREAKAVKKVLKSGWTTNGPKVKELESMFQEITGMYAVAVSSATAGLLLSINVSSKVVKGIKGKKVVTTPLTFVATIEAIKQNGFEPYYCDISLKDYNLDINKLDIPKEEIAGYVPVNYGGVYCDLKLPYLDGVKIEKNNFIVNYRNFTVVDAAHCAPNKIKEQVGGNFVFSFHANKIISCGEGGMICTRSAENADKMEYMRKHGMVVIDDIRKPYDIYEEGYKMNMSDINAAIAIEQLKKLDFLTGVREEIALQYIEELKDIIEIKIPEFNSQNSFHLFPILTENGKEFTNALLEKGIITSCHYTSVPMLKAYYNKKVLEKIPNAIKASENLVSLPIYPDLNPKKVKKICKSIKEIVKEI